MAVLGASVYGRDGYGNTDELYITDRTENDLRNNTYKAYLNPEHMQWLSGRVLTLLFMYLGQYQPLDFQPTSTPFTYLYVDGVGAEGTSQTQTATPRSANELARRVKKLVNHMTKYKPEFEIPDNLDKADIYTVNNLERAVRDMWGDR